MSHNSIRSLVYISTAKAGLGEADIESILETAQRNNKQNKLTGLLVFNGTNFMQLLEGAAEDVNNCMAIIANDPRHHGMVVVCRDDMAQREFPDWYMAGRIITVPAKAGLEEIFTVESVGEKTRQLLKNFSTLGVPQSSMRKEAPGTDAS